MRSVLCLHGGRASDAVHTCDRGLRENIRDLPRQSQIRNRYENSRPCRCQKNNLEYSNTNDLAVAIRHLQLGGHIIAHVGVPVGKEIGLFTKGGHYISLVSTDGKEFCILDPSYTENKFDIPERVGKVNTANSPYLYCDVNIVDSECAPGKIKYHLFKRKKQ